MFPDTCRSTIRPARPSRRLPYPNGANGNSNGAKKRINPIKLKQMQDRHQQVEEGIARLEHGIAQCERELQSYVSAEETQRQTDLLAQYRAEVAQKMEDWEELSNALEAPANLKPSQLLRQQPTDNSLLLHQFIGQQLSFFCQVRSPLVIAFGDGLP